MSLESFFGLEDAEGQGSAEAAEKFREQMRAAAKAIANMQVHAQAQQTQEDKLAQLLVKFIMDPSKSDLVFIVVKLLEENVPGPFVLAMVSISELTLLEEIKPMLKPFAPKSSESVEAQAVTPFSRSTDLPEVLQKELNDWGQVILEAGLMRPGKTLSTLLTPDLKLKSLVIDLLEYVLEEYFEKKAFEVSEEALRQFSLLAIQTVLLKLREVSREKSDVDIIESPLGVSSEGMTSAA